MTIPMRAKTLTAAIWLAVMALVLRALLPGGYMLVADRPGGVLPLVVPCSGYGPLFAASAPAHKNHGADPAGQDQPSENGPDQPCSFAGLADPIADGVTPALAVLPTIAATLVLIQLLTLVIPSGLAAPPPPAIGPPTGL